MVLYDNIKKYRLQRNMTQQQLANLTGYGDRSSIAKIEKGLVDIPQSKVELFAKVLHVPAGELMGTTDADTDSVSPTNLSTPAAYPVPVLGTICAGNGRICEESFDGYFFIDHSVRADYCLHVEGDSMIDAEIYDGDIAFILADYDFQDGNIYAVLYGMDERAVLKKVYREDGHLILMPCNSAYKPIIADPDDVCVVGECVGVYRTV